MLIRFIVENFRNFKNETAIEVFDNIPKKGFNILNTNVIFGANGCGKSNLIKAVAYAREVILRNSNKLKNEGFVGTNSQTTFKFEVLLEGVVYIYSFSFFKNKITDEYLGYLVDEKNGEWETIFERTKDKTIFNKGFVNKPNQAKALEVGDNQLILNKLNTVVLKKPNKTVQKVFKWFVELVILNKDTDFIKTNNDNFEFFKECLKSFDTGITDVVTKTEKDMSVEKYLYASVNHGLMTKQFVYIRKNNSLIKVFSGKRGFVIEKCFALHGKNKFRFQQESDGTNKLINILLAVLNPNKTVFIDDIDINLHDRTFKKLMELLTVYCKANKTQLIATVHNTDLFDVCDSSYKNVFDNPFEIMFINRYKEDVSEAHYLSEFKGKQRIENCKRGYLQGRYNSIPYLGRMDRLIDELKAN